MKAGAPRQRSKSSLAIIERAFRGSLEEQYGHIVWLSRVMKGMGAEHGLLLKGDCVLYARRQQPRVRLSIGDALVDDLSHYASGVSELITLGMQVYVHSPDLGRLRLAPDDLVAGVHPVSDATMPELIRRYDCVWYW